MSSEYYENEKSSEMKHIIKNLEDGIEDFCKLQYHQRCNKNITMYAISLRLDNMSCMGRTLFNDYDFLMECFTKFPECYVYFVDHVKDIHVFRQMIKIHPSYIAKLPEAQKDKECLLTAWHSDMKNILYASSSILIDDKEIRNLYDRANIVYGNANDENECKDEKEIPQRYKIKHHQEHNFLYINNGINHITDEMDKIESVKRTEMIEKIKKMESVEQIEKIDVPWAFLKSTEAILSNGEIAKIIKEDKNCDILKSNPGVVGVSSEVFVAAYKYGGMTFKEASNEIKNDKSIVEMVVRDNPRNLLLAQKKFLKDIDIVLIAIDKDPTLIEYIDPSISFDPLLARKIIKVSPEMFEKYASDDSIVDDPDIVMTAIKFDASLIRFAGANCRADEYIAKHVLERDWKLIKYLGRDLLSDLSFMTFALKKNSETIRYGSKEIRSNITLMKKAINDSPENSRYACGEALHDQEILDIVLLYSIIDENENIRDEIKKNIDFAQKMIQIDGTCIKYVKKLNIRMIMTAIHNNPEAWMYIPEKFQKNYDVICEVYRHNPEVLEVWEVSKNLQTFIKAKMQMKYHIRRSDVIIDYV